ncbi:MAG: small multi-drug export protein, partial [Clostridia bacterium]
MAELIIEFFKNLLHNDILTTIIIAIFPIVELRGAIPVAISMGLTPFEALMWAWLGSSLVVPVLLLLLKPMLNWLKGYKIFYRLATGTEEMFNSKAEKIANKHGDTSKKSFWFKLIGVLLFVAVPAPLTGVWTGSAVAVFLGLPFLPSLIAVLLGNLFAGVIVTLLSMFFASYLDTIVLAFFALVIVLFIIFVFKLVKHMKMVDMTKFVKKEKTKKTENDVNAENKDNAQNNAKIGNKDNAQNNVNAENKDNAQNSAKIGNKDNAQNDVNVEN